MPGTSRCHWGVLEAPGGKLLPATHTDGAKRIMADVPAVKGKPRGADSTASMVGLAGSHAYIRVNNGVFVDDDCNEFTFSGYNTWQVMLMLHTDILLQMKISPSFLGTLESPATQTGRHTPRSCL